MVCKFSRDHVELYNLSEPPFSHPVNGIDDNYFGLIVTLTKCYRISRITVVNNRSSVNWQVMLLMSNLLKGETVLFMNGF